MGSGRGAVGGATAGPGSGVCSPGFWDVSETLPVPAPDPPPGDGGSGSSGLSESCLSGRVVQPGTGVVSTCSPPEPGCGGLPEALVREEASFRSRNGHSCTSPADRKSKTPGSEVGRPVQSAPDGHGHADWSLRTARRVPVCEEKAPFHDLGTGTLAVRSQTGSQTCPVLRSGDRLSHAPGGYGHADWSLRTARRVPVSEGRAPFTTSERALLHFAGGPEVENARFESGSGIRWPPRPGHSGFGLSLR